MKCPHERKKETERETPKKKKREMCIHRKKKKDLKEINLKYCQ